MKRLTAATGAGLAAIALSFALAGCGSDTKTESSTASSTSKSSETSKTSTSKAAPSTSAEAAGPNKTISDYITENKIKETSIKRGDPGPTIDLPVPPGWETKEGLPEAPYGAIIFPTSAVPTNPPRILALLSKLTGDVDQEEILNLAPGELRNLPGFDGPPEGQRDQLGGFDAVQLGGTYADGAKKGMVAQKTVVIPADDGVYVLQLNAFADESEANILMDATSVIDEQTTITP
ncbi:LpqN/LpqT family lipoprotein [soil metagenome]